METKASKKGEKTGEENIPTKLWGWVDCYCTRCEKVTPHKLCEIEGDFILCFDEAIHKFKQCDDCHTYSQVRATRNKQHVRK